MTASVLIQWWMLLVNKLKLKPDVLRMKWKMFEGFVS